MSTTALCGMTGSVSLGGEVSKWTLNLNIETIDVTSMASSGSKEFIGCLKDADGTFESYTPCGGVGASAGLVLTNAADSYTMDAIIESVATEVDVHGAVKFVYSFRSSGEVT